MTAPAEPRKRSALREWRNWSLPVKFAAVALVPVVFAVTLGVAQIRWQVQQANDYHRVAAVLDTAQQIEPLVEALQNERNAAVLKVSGGNSDLDNQIAAVEAATRAADEVMGDPKDHGQVVADRYGEMHTALGKLRSARALVRQGVAPVPTTISGYGTAIKTVLNLDRALTSTVSEPSLASTASALQDMLGLMEEVRVQEAWVLSGLAKGNLEPQAISELQGSRARLFDKISDARSTIARHWQQRLDATMLSPQIAERNKLLTMVIMASTDNEKSGGYPVTPEQWRGVSDQVVQLIDQGHNDLAKEVRGGAARLESGASDAAGWDSTLLLAALVAAAAVMITMSRQLLGSLGNLRRGALDAAQRELPEAVEGIRAGGEVAEIRPVPVETTDEVGQVARAFDQVHQQALRLASEQAALRHGYSESFVGVSRRSQSLLERQLRLFEELEQDEEDPDQLSRLFQLDHLATRMRRNNENLMVLSGSDLARRFVRPTELADVLRAAVSEIEQYPRVVVQPPPAAQLVGHAASDMVRLMAELLDNAANFSSPDTSVTVSSYQAGDGSVTVDVLDEGIGMGQAELAEMNSRLARVDDNDLATSRRMGMFVVGRLAARHGIVVRLHGGPEMEGVRATVVVPAEHLITAAPPAAGQPTPAKGGQRNGFAHHDLPTSGSFSTASQAPGAPTTAAGQQEETGFRWSGGFETGASRTGSADTGSAAPQALGTPGENTFNTGFVTGGPDGGEVPMEAPLPKREPSAGLFGPSQREDDDKDSGEPTANLFTPLDIPEQPDSPDYSSDWTSSGLAWPPAIDDSRPTEEAESPIFEEVSTQWFQPSAEDARYQARSGQDENPWPAETSTSDSGSWAFPAEAAAEAREAQSREAQPPGTESGEGLPRRDARGAGAAESGPAEMRIDESDPLGIDHLSEGGEHGFGNGSYRPGTGSGRSEVDSVGAGSAESAESGRSPRELSRRLADLQGGLRFGRKGPMQSSQDSAEQDAPAQQEEHSSAPQPGAGSSWLTAAEPESNGASQFNGAEAPASENGGWSFATDDAWRQAEAAVTSNPTSFTSSGLPRRTPKAQLAPGSANASEQQEERTYERDANALRGRLSSFQTGVQRGRHRAPDES